VTTDGRTGFFSLTMPRVNPKVSGLSR